MAQCAKTFLYEALPMYGSLPVILFVECVLGQRSLGAALTLARNRMLYLTTWKGALVPLPVQVLLYLLPNWCMVCGIVIWYHDADAQKLFDPWELFVMWLVVLMRHFVVAVKYGYLPASEIVAQYSKQYGPVQLAKGIFLGGWATPRAPGFDIIEQEIDTAMWMVDVDLRRCPLQLRLSDTEPGSPSGTTMTAHELGLMIAMRCYGKPLAASATPIALLTGIALPFLPAVARAATGLPAFGGGMSWGPKLLAFCQIWGPFSYIWLMCGYHRLSLHSYNRRAKAMELFDELCSVGIASTELDSLDSEVPGPQPQPQPEPETGPPVAGDGSDPDLLSPKLVLPSAHIAFDLTDASTVVSVVLLRRCLRHYVRCNSKIVLRRTWPFSHPLIPPTRCSSTLLDHVCGRRGRDTTPGLMRSPSPCSSLAAY
eukprot:COSAG02_NODE_4580_length_5199_cov_6.923137_4_plen_426_part_00